MAGFVDASVPLNHFNARAVNAEWLQNKIIETTRDVTEVRVVFQDPRSETEARITALQHRARQRPPAHAPTSDDGCCPERARAEAV
jgi:hypothetical protein